MLITSNSPDLGKMDIQSAEIFEKGLVSCQTDEVVAIPVSKRASKDRVVSNENHY